MSDVHVMSLHQRHRRRLRLLFLAVACLIGLAFAWRWTSLSDYLDVDRMVLLVRSSGIAQKPYIAIAGVVVASVLAIPLAVIIVAGAVIYGPILGLVYVLAGAEIGATISFALGKFLGHHALRLLAGERMIKLSESLGRNGIVTVIVIRLVPVAPFAVANMVAGASHIRLRDFLLGTIIGMIPGALAITLFVDQIVAAIRTPGWQSLVIAIAVLILLIGGAYVLRRWLEKFQNADVGGNENRIT